MKLDDRAFPLRSDIVLTSNTYESFEGASWDLLVGSVPRKAGISGSSPLALPRIDIECR
ncbi:MAG TPA: hypothetical protein VIJ30_07370 [Candidatus Dormibacteraeota bacterium]